MSQAPWAQGLIDLASVPVVRRTYWYVPMGKIRFETGGERRTSSLEVPRHLGRGFKGATSSLDYCLYTSIF